MKLVFATNNPNKLSEIRDLVPTGIEILSLKDINCNEELPEQTLLWKVMLCRKQNMYLITMVLIVLQTIPV